MRRSAKPLAGVIALLAAAAATPAMAAESQHVKVALLDMTSMVPGMAGYGMMGPGMMGQGMMGQGMMGPMMRGMMGPGMMMGMMTVRTDRSSAKAGSVTFDVTNWSSSVLHELLVVAVDNPAAPLPYDYAQAKVVEDQVKVLGEAADLEPNASKSFDATLSPGSYLLICNVPGHYAAGMVASFSITP